MALDGRPRVSQRHGVGVGGEDVEAGAQHVRYRVELSRVWRRRTARAMAAARLRGWLAVAVDGEGYRAAKALARLLQAGIDPSTGSLPSPTTPTEVWFWLAVAAAPTLALLELTFGAKAAAAAAKAAGGEGGEDGEAAGGGAGGTGKKGEGDPAAEVKKAYIKRTEPKEIRSIARMATMMR